MIEWVKDKFSSLISVFFVLFVALITAFGGLTGYALAKELYLSVTIGGLIGLAVGFFLGMIAGILSFGLIATIIDISETENAILLKLMAFQKDSEKNLKAIDETQDGIKILLSNIDSKIVNQKRNLADSNAAGDSVQEKNDAAENEEEYTVVHKNGRVFAMRGSNYYCMKCHAFIDSEMKSMCPNCGSSLMG